MKKYLIISATLFFAFLANVDAEIARGKIVVLMQGFRSDQGKVHVALFNSANGFPIYQGRSYKVIVTTVNNKKSEVIFTDIHYGVYAVSVLHDENSNGTMDTSWLMLPKEGYAASNNAKSKIGTPSFRAAQFELNSPEKTIEIAINY